eukprot:12850472-Alexandrium_andersonii.AAC.1
MLRSHAHSEAMHPKALQNSAERRRAVQKPCRAAQSSAEQRGTVQNGTQQRRSSAAPRGAFQSTAENSATPSASGTMKS